MKSLKKKKGIWRLKKIIAFGRTNFIIMLYRVHLACLTSKPTAPTLIENIKIDIIEAGFELTTLVVIGTDYTGLFLVKMILIFLTIYFKMKSLKKKKGIWRLKKIIAFGN
jgi:hypothetical protein